MNRFDASNAGPGSYNINSEFHQKSAVLPNPPRFFMPKAKNASNLFISKSHNTYRLGRCSPESNHNNPNFDALFHKTISAKFGVSKRIDYFTSAQFRSPGPIYSLPKYKSPSTSFGNHRGGSSKNMNRKMIKTYKGTSVFDTRKLFDSNF